MSKKYIFVVALLALTFLLAGCNIEYDTRIQPNGSGRLTISAKFTPEEVEMIQSDTSDPDMFCRDLWADNLESDFPPGTVIRSEIHDEDTWCIAEMSFSDFQQLRSIYDGQSVTVNRLEIADNVLYYDVSIDMAGSSPLSQFFLVTWKVTMPGRVLSHNAQQVDGKTLTWLLKPDELNRLQAESQVSGMDWLWWVAGGLACLCLIVVVIGGGVGLFFYLRSRKKAAPVS